MATTEPKEEETTMIRKNLLSAGLMAAVAIAGLTLGTGSAEAVKMRKCPDGSWVSCTQPCPGKFKTKGPHGPRHVDSQHRGFRSKVVWNQQMPKHPRR
jgi:hypothetical protein